MTETRLTRDDAYEEMGMAYQILQLDLLNQAMKENGVDEAGLRQKICEAFLFSLGDFHDEGWFDADGKRVYPLLCFSTNYLDSDTGVDELGDVFAPSTSFEFHEYAHFMGSWYFEDHNEDASEIQRGSLGE